MFEALRLFIQILKGAFLVKIAIKYCLTKVLDNKKYIRFYALKMLKTMLKMFKILVKNRINKPFFNVEKCFYNVENSIFNNLHRVFNNL